MAAQAVMAGSAHSEQQGLLVSFSRPPLTMIEWYDFYIFGSLQR
ncbi:hypothetical protein [Candidatus Villigracilis affinis]